MYLRYHDGHAVVGGTIAWWSMPVWEAANQGETALAPSTAMPGLRYRWRSVSRARYLAMAVQ